MSRYVDIEPIIESIYAKWGCDPAYYVGVSGADAHEAKLDADLIEFLRSKPSIDIVKCSECKHLLWGKDYKGRYEHYCGFTEFAVPRPDCHFCGDGERKEKSQ